ncbi:MAG: hypothetical protein EOM80_12705 [Erysipelotrichia bacterium]|nr:hypothetical protein [Erysipelotrichia bacterium]
MPEKKGQAGKITSIKYDSTALAKALVCILTGSGNTSRHFMQIHDLARYEIRCLIKKWGLSLVVENDQMSDTLLDFLEDISSPPDENAFVAHVIALCRRQPADYLKQVQFYVSRRLFTLLKKNANSRSKEYMSFNSQIKRVLPLLADERKIFSRSFDYWSGNDTPDCPAIDMNQINQRIITSLPLKRLYSDKNGRLKNSFLRESIVKLLCDAPHFDYKFKKSLISTVLFKLNDLNQQCRSLDQFDSDTGLTNSIDAASSAINLIKNPATALIIEQLKLQFKNNEQPQVLLAGLGYFFTTSPDYFKKSDFLPDHYAILASDIGDIDRIHNFLNALPKRDLLLKRPGRTTVFNRIQSFKILLETILIDYPVEIKQSGIKELVQYMLEQYQSIFEEAAK